MTNSIHEILHDIQRDLKAPKNQVNKFGGYKYRSCEDILEGVKPLLPKGVYLTINDEVVEVGGRVYVKATAMIRQEGADYVTATAYAREPETKKGMDEAQITGATSSYARKYALNGLFCIDDTKDADAKENAPEGQETAKKAQPQKKQAEPLSDAEFKKHVDLLTYTVENAGDRKAFDQVLEGARKDANRMTKEQKQDFASLSAKLAVELDNRELEANMEKANG